MIRLPTFSIILWGIIGCLLATFPKGAFAQQFHFQHLTEDDGLPSVYLYDIVQGEDGFIWITGESGLFRFDGKKFTAPAVEKALNKEIIRFFPGKDNRIWLLDLMSQVSYLENNKVFATDISSPAANYGLTELHTMRNGRTYLANPRGLWEIKSDTTTVLPVPVLQKKLRGWKRFLELRDSSLLLFSYDGTYRIQGEGVQYQTFEQPLNSSGYCFALELGDSVLIAFRQELFFYDPKTNQLIPAFSEYEAAFAEGIIGIKRSSYGDIWILTEGGLLQISPMENNEFQLEKHLEGIVMGNMVEDREGNLWLTTQRDGIYYLSAHRLELLDIPDWNEPISVIRTDAKGQIILGFENGRVVIVDKNFRVVVDRNPLGAKHRLYDIVVDKEGNYHFFTSKTYMVWDQKYRLLSTQDKLYFKCATLSTDGRIWVGTGTSMGYLDEQGYHRMLMERTYAVLLINEDEAWIGTTPGLIHYRNGNIDRKQHPLLRQDIRDIKMGGEGELWLATQGNGLIVYHPEQDSIWQHFTQENGLNTNHCRKLLVEADFVWLATKKGISKIDRRNYEILSVCTDEGLPSDEVNDLYRFGDKILVATNRGAVIIPDTLKVKREPPLLLFTNIKIEEKDTSIQAFYELDYFQNDLEIKFDGIAFRHAEDVEYAYRMEGVDEDWRYSQVEVAQYPAMAPGDYLFKVKTRTVNSDWSAEKSIRFQIARPFWRSLWFYTLMFLLAGGIGAFITTSNVRRANRRIAAERELKASQLTALRAQMNPHFVFNALNSIQEFILTSNSRYANRYLSQFARLMRNVLNFSDKGQISLKKEIETLQLYLSLESLRFGDQFTYHFEVDEGIEPESCQIPPMLLQPFVENAIKHGLMHKNGSKNLYLRFYPQDNYLICEIEDDGIGRARSSEIRKRNPNLYPSKAISLTKERLQLLSAVTSYTLEVKVHDLKDKLENPTGTRVILQLGPLRDKIN